MIKRQAYTFGLSEWEEMEKFLGERNYGINREEGRITVMEKFGEKEKPRTVANIGNSHMYGVETVEILIFEDEGLEKVISEFEAKKNPPYQNA